MNRVFLLSPANCNGERARWLIKKNARSELAQRLRQPEGAPLGEVFTFLSALYFRGKLAYARAFANPPASAEGVWIITPTAGLVPHDISVRLSTLRGFARVPIRKQHPLYRRSLARSARQLAAACDGECEIVLLGSIASGKYLDILGAILGERLRVPREFVGLGDMSRGGLLLRCVREQRELEYVPVHAAFANPESKRFRVSRPASRVPLPPDSPPAIPDEIGAPKAQRPRIKIFP